MPTTKPISSNKSSRKPKPKRTSRGARAPKLTAEEWQHWEDLYVYGTMTLEDLSRRPGAPHPTGFKERSRARNWVLKRQQVADRITTRARELAQETANAILERHAAQGRVLQAIANKGLQAVKPTKLKPRELLDFSKVGVEMEAQARGLNAKRVELTGKDGAPVRVEQDLSSANADTLMQAYRALLTEED